MAVVVATIQSIIAADVRLNGRRIRAQLVAAARQGARLAHFPEAALSGYIVSEVADWTGVDWTALQEELAETAALAKRLGMWAVIGSNHPLPAPRWPHNSLYVISDQGVLAGRYDKRLCSNTEVTYWYTPGTAPLALDVDGVRFGCALCIEVVFPHLFAEYERLGTHCMLLSSYSNDATHGLMARAHAATTCMWVSMATPAVCQDQPSMLVGPDGNPAALCTPGMPGMVVQRIDPADVRYRVPLLVARAWRAQARAGGIYAGRTAPLS